MRRRTTFRNSRVRSGLTMATNPKSIDKGKLIKPFDFSEILPTPHGAPSTKTATTTTTTTTTTTPAPKRSLRTEATIKPTRVSRRTKRTRAPPRTTVPVVNTPKTRRTTLTSMPTKQTTSLRPSTVPNDDGVPLAIYIGAAIGGAVLISLVILLIVCCVRRRRRLAVKKRAKSSHDASSNGLAMLYRVQSTSSENALLVRECNERNSDQLGGSDRSDRGIVNQGLAPSPLLISCNGRNSKSSERKVRNGSNTETCSPSTPDTTGEGIHNLLASVLSTDVFSETSTTNESDSHYENGYVRPDFDLGEGLKKGPATIDPLAKSQTLGTDISQPRKASGGVEKRLSLSQLKWVHTPRVIHGMNTEEASLYVPMDASFQGNVNANIALNVKDPIRKPSLPARPLATPPKPCGSSQNQNSSYVNMTGTETSSAPDIPDDSQSPYYEAIYLSPVKASTPAPPVIDGMGTQEVEPSENYENISNIGEHTERPYSNLEISEARTNSVYSTPSETRESISREGTTGSLYITTLQTPDLNESENKRTIKCTDSLYHTPRQTPEFKRTDTKLANSVYDSPRQTPELNRRESGETHKDFNTFDRKEEQIFPKTMAQSTATQDCRENSSMASAEKLGDQENHLYEEAGENYLTTSLENKDGECSETDNIYDIPSALNQGLNTDFTPKRYSSKGQEKAETVTKLQEQSCSQAENVNTANVYENTVLTPMESGQSKSTAEEYSGISGTYVKQSCGTYMNESSLDSTTTVNLTNDVYEVPSSVFEAEPILLKSAENSSIPTSKRTDTQDRTSSSQKVKNAPGVGNEDAVKSDSEPPDVDTKNIYDIPQSFVESVHRDEKPTKPKPAKAPKPQTRTLLSKSLDHAGSKSASSPTEPQQCFQSEMDSLEKTAAKAKTVTFNGPETASSKARSSDKSQPQENAPKTALKPQSPTNSTDNSSSSLKSASYKPSEKLLKNKKAATEIRKNDDDDDDDKDTADHLYVNMKAAESPPNQGITRSFSSEALSSGMNMRKSPKVFSRHKSVDHDRRNLVNETTSPTSPSLSPVDKGKKPPPLVKGNSKNSSGSFDMTELEMALRGVRERKS